MKIPNLLRTAAFITLLSMLCSCDTSESSTHTESTIAPAANELREPMTLSSENGVLDLLVVAKAAVVPQLTPYQPTGWVYDICQRPVDGSNQCPASNTNTNPYGGTRLQVNPGDLLKIHLINQLPPVLDSEHASEDGEAFLALNPTNIHLHGMLVSPSYATSANGAWGDNVFVLNFNSANGAPAPSPHLHAAVQFDATDYSVQIPADHPSGLYWFHPHVHGISVNQLTAGLSGILTVGQVGDYLCPNGVCGADLSQIPVRHILLKDTQILKGGTLQTQLDSGFCSGPTAVAPEQGGCAGANTTTTGGPDYTGGRWFFTLNGQQYPTVTVGAQAGEIWRITNASASATYDLNLWDPDEQHEMLMKVLSIDGVSVDVGAGTNANELVDQAGNKFQPVPCPDVNGLAATGVCTTRLHLMPSSRAEVWVVHRDGKGVIQSPSAGSHAILRTNGYQTGPTGDAWPAVDLANVRFAQGTFSTTDIVSRGQAHKLKYPERLATNLRHANTLVPADPNCTPLPSGHKRRIFFNVPADNPDGFGLGYEEVDQNDVLVPGTFIDVKPFDPSSPTICLPLASGNMPTIERWELVNLASEDHNFHIHQVHFSVLSAGEVAYTSVPGQLQNHTVMMDSLPLPHADGNCATVDDWRNGVCIAHIATVEIPFTIAGDFVYHCHILEHEDGGMMAVIRVRPDPATSSTSLVDRLLATVGLSTPALRQPVSPFSLNSKICRSRRAKSVVTTAGAASRSTSLR